MNQLLKDLKKSRKVCQELDARYIFSCITCFIWSEFILQFFFFFVNFRNGLELPVSSHFWPIYKVTEEDDVSSSKKRRIEESECTTESFTYFNGKAAPDDLNIDELPKDNITEWYSMLLDIKH